MNVKRLLTVWFACVLLGTVVAVPQVQAQDVSSDLLGRINALRGSLGLSPYALNGALNAAAQNHAAWMVETGQVSHTQPNGSTPSSRAAAAGYVSSWVSENIYMGTSATVDSAWTFWMNSPIHYRGLTNTNYSEVGIASATANGMRSYVLVFGNPSGIAAAPRSSRSSASGDNSAPAGPPPFVVGVDNVGNIMHEIQPGHTLGEIALIYGYDWDDLQAIRDLNDMTEPEGRQLEVGAVLLIPPYEGTYTPTPGGAPVEAVVESETTPAAPDPFSAPYEESEDVAQQFEANSTPQVVNMMQAGATATPPPPVQTVTPAQVDTTQVVPREDVPNPPIVEGNGNWTAATVTPGITEVAMVEQPQTGGIIEPVTVQAEPEDEDDGGLHPLIYVAIGLQIGVVLMAGVAFFRRRTA